MVLIGWYGYRYYQDRLERRMSENEYNTAVTLWEFAKQIKSPTVTEAISRGYETALGRKPTKEESTLAAGFIEQQTTSYRDNKQPDPESAALADFCQALMSTNEFVYIE